MKKFLFTLCIAVFFYSCGDNPTAPSNNNQNQPVLIYSNDSITFNWEYLIGTNLTCDSTQIKFDYNAGSDTLYIGIMDSTQTSTTVFKFTRSPVTKSFRTRNINAIYFTYIYHSIITNFKIYRF